MQRAPTFALLLLAVSAVPLRGQGQDMPPAPLQRPDTSIRRFEVGEAVTGVRAGCNSTGCGSLSYGFGATINLNRHFALDTEVNLTPASTTSTNAYGGRLSEYLFGARAEIRGRRYGYFLKAQPGVLNWNHVITGVDLPIQLGTIPFTFGEVDRFVSDVGGGFEYSPTARIHVRTEVGDLVMRYGPGSWINNLQSTAGVYVGLGKPIAWTPPVYDAGKSHRFFGRENEVLITASLLGMTADAITTQRFISRGQIEGDPLARPLVKYGWSGQISLEALEAGAEILGMYGLHRIGKHWLERLVPMSISTAHAIFAYGNDRISYKSASTKP